MPDLAEIADRLGELSAGLLQPRLAVVQSVQTGPPRTVTVTFSDGNSVAPAAFGGLIPAGPQQVAAVLIVGGYTPTVGDVIVVLQYAAGTLYCLGNVG